MNTFLFIETVSAKTGITEEGNKFFSWMYKSYLEIKCWADGRVYD
jgi:hypothetical protein